MQQFQVGAKYKTSSICDADCFFHFTVVGRTDKTVTIVGDLLKTPIRRKIKEFTSGEESFLPYGAGSMSPVISTSDFYQ